MADYNKLSVEFEIEQVNNRFYSGNLELLDGKKIKELIQKYQNLPNHEKNSVSKLKTIVNIIEGKFVVGLI